MQTNMFLCVTQRTCFSHIHNVSLFSRQRPNHHISTMKIISLERLPQNNCQCFCEMKYMSSLPPTGCKSFGRFRKSPREDSLLLVPCGLDTKLSQLQPPPPFSNSNAKSLLKLFRRNTHFPWREVERNLW